MVGLSGLAGFFYASDTPPGGVFDFDDEHFISPGSQGMTFLVNGLSGGTVAIQKLMSDGNWATVASRTGDGSQKEEDIPIGATCRIRFNNATTGGTLRVEVQPVGGY